VCLYVQGTNVTSTLEFHQLSCLYYYSEKIEKCAGDGISSYIMFMPRCVKISRLIEKGLMGGDHAHTQNVIFTYFLTYFHNSAMSAAMVIQCQVKNDSRSSPLGRFLVLISVRG
jgi:hypothetical protein